MTTQARRPPVEVTRIVLRTDDPSAETDKVLVYAREVDGVVRILARYANGQVNIIL